MEQRKVLLIVASVSVVLAVTIGVGLWLFYPRDDSVPVADARRTGGLEWEPLDFLQGLSDRPGLDRVADDSVRRDDSFEVTYGVTVDPPASPATRAPEDGPAAPTDTRRVAVEAVPAVPRADPAPAPAPAPTAAPAPQPAAARQPATPATAPRAPSVVAAPASAPRAVPAPAPRTAPQAYWVQVISSPNLDTAEQAQRTLAERQLGTRIMTREINGTIYYRLRLGPFAVRTEAEKFLDWVLELRQFSDAMIFVDFTTPVVDPARS